MSARSSLVVALCLTALSCSQPSGPPLTISDIAVLEPLPGSGMTAGYLTIENHSDLPITIVKVTSATFASIEMHETVIENDVAKMVALGPLVVEQKTKIVFAPGGKHLMMSGAVKPLAPGMPVTVNFHDSGNGLVSVATTIRSRQQVQE